VITHSSIVCLLKILFLRIDHQR